MFLFCFIGKSSCKKAAPAKVMIRESMQSALSYNKM